MNAEGEGVSVGINETKRSNGAACIVILLTSTTNAMHDDMNGGQ